MAENPRIAWLIAFDADSPRLRCDDFVQLSVKECKTTLVDATRVLVRLRLEKRVRSNQVVEELRRLLDDGRIQCAWIERRPTAGHDPNEAPTELERVHDESGEGFAGKAKKKPSAPVAKTPDAEQESEGEEEEDEEVRSLIRACMQDIQQRMRQLEHQLRSHKRSKKHHPPPPVAIPPPKPPHVEYNRPPVKLSFLRTASVSELYFSGVWVPEFDVDPSFTRRPNRECRFRSELPADQYVEGYDIDDETHQHVALLCSSKADALQRASYMHFVDRRPTRPAVTLRALRHSPLSVLSYLKVFLLSYDIDDESRLPESIPNRPRMTRTELAAKGGISPEWSPEGYYLVGCPFIPGYDIDDHAALEEGQLIQSLALATKQDIHRERKASVP
jgi:hypothetical protein